MQAGWQLSSARLTKQKLWKTKILGFLKNGVEDQPPKRTADIEDRPNEPQKDFDKGCDCKIKSTNWG